MNTIYKQSFLITFRLNTIAITSILGSIFAQSEPKTIERNVLQKNMDQSSFHNSLDAILTTMTKSRQAYFLHSVYKEYNSEILRFLYFEFIH